MALEILDGIEKIGEFDLVVMDDLREKYPEKFIPSGQMDWKWFESEVRPFKHIYLRKDKNSISFTLQKGPIKEVGVNGCQVDALIETAKLILIGLNEKFPSTYNKLAIAYLQEALHNLTARKKDREARGVEGTNAE